jgi:hypothetical protein
VQCPLQADKIAALLQPHVLGETGELIEIRRIVCYSSNARLREIIKFHASAQSDSRAIRFLAIVRAVSAGTDWQKDQETVRFQVLTGTNCSGTSDESNQLFRAAQVL